MWDMDWGPILTTGKNQRGTNLASHNDRTAISFESEIQMMEGTFDINVMCALHSQQKNKRQSAMASVLGMSRVAESREERNQVVHLRVLFASKPFRRTCCAQSNSWTTSKSSTHNITERHTSISNIHIIIHSSDAIDPSVVPIII